MNKFPPELLIYVFKQLPFFMILHARQVCKFWLEVIQSSVELEYQIELEAHRKTDGALTSNLSIDLRLQALRKHATAWRDLSWSRTDIFDFSDLFPQFEDPEHARALLNGWALGGQDRISLHSFPSTLAQGLPVSHMPFSLSLSAGVFLIDVDQDVIIFERPDDLGASRCTIRAQALSTADDPLTEQRILYRFDTADLRVTCKELQDDLLLFCASSSVQVAVIIFQWTTGRMVSKLEFDSPGIGHRYQAAFLSSQRFLFTGGTMGFPLNSVIALYEFRVSQQLDEVTTPVHITSYLLPPRHPVDAFIVITSRPPKSSTLRHPSPKLCTDSADDWIVCFQYWQSHQDIGNPLLIMTHASNLLRHASNTTGSLPIQVPWAQWGLDRARCLTTPQILRTSRFLAMVPTHGERFAYASRYPQDNSMHCIKMYDFNQTRVRRVRHSACSPSWPPFQSGNAVHSLVDTAPEGDATRHPAFEGDQITGRLPYLVTSVDVEVKGVDRFGMDEEHLIFLTSPDDQPFHDYGLTVFTM